MLESLFETSREMGLVNLRNLEDPLLRRASLGEEKGVNCDPLQVISKNRSECATTAYGSYGAGCAHVPMYEQQKPSEWEYILADSGASVLFVSRRDLLADALAACGPSVRQVLCFDEPTGSHSFADAMQAGAQRESAPRDPRLLGVRATDRSHSKTREVLTAARDYVGLQATPLSCPPRTTSPRSSTPRAHTLPRLFCMGFFS